MSHTPKPWTMRRNPENPDNWWIDGPKRTEFAETVGPPICSLDGNIAAEDNARLIAAAPDLLEALEAARAELGITDKFLPITVKAEVARQINAAIARAKGN